MKTNFSECKIAAEQLEEFPYATTSMREFVDQEKFFAIVLKGTDVVDGLYTVRSFNWQPETLHSIARLGYIAEDADRVINANPHLKLDWIIGDVSFARNDLSLINIKFKILWNEMNESSTPQENQAGST